MSEALAELFSSKVRAAVLAHLLPRPHLGFSLTDLSHLLGLPVSSLQHECYKLVRIGALKDARDGAARRYRPNPAFPLLAALTGLVLRDLDLETGLRAAAEGIAALELAFVARPAGAAAPATLVVVGLLEVEALDDLLARVTTVLVAHGGPPPELAFFPPAEWHGRVGASNALVRSLLVAPRLAIAGDDGDR